jgi:Protein of unknown function (DUF4239)
VARSLLNSLSTLEIVCLFIGGCVTLALTITFVIRRLVPDLAERQFEELADGLRVVYELMFALLLAFVIASVLDKVGDSEEAVAREATALTQMQRNNLAFGPKTDQRLFDGMRSYIIATVNDEWPAMAQGRSSDEAAAALETVYLLYQGVSPTGTARTQAYEQALAHLDEVASARRDRLALSSSRLSTLLLIMLPVGALLLMLLEYRSRLGVWTQGLFMGILAIVLSATYLLTIILDYPFSGDMAVSSAPLREGSLASFFGTTPRVPQPGDKQLTLTTGKLVGVWHSDAYGTIFLAARNHEIRGAYRSANGTVRGIVDTDGVFRGVWCKEPTRKGGTRPGDGDAGYVEWRLISSKRDGTFLQGTWSYGFQLRPDLTFTSAGDWDLQRLELDEALDLRKQVQLNPPSAYCYPP